MIEEIQPLLQSEIQSLINDLLFKYGLIATLIILFVLIIGWLWIRRKIEGEVEKGINEHRASIENIYARKIENYRLYIDKKHTAYSKLHQLLLEAEGYINTQKLAYHPDFRKLSKIELTRYLQDKNATRYEIKHLLTFMEKPDELQQQMQNFCKKFKLIEARRIWAESRNYFWFNVLYLTDTIENLFTEISNKLYKLLLIQEMPSGRNGEMTPDDWKKARAMENEIKPMISNIIKLMKKEISVGTSE